MLFQHFPTQANKNPLYLFLIRKQKKRVISVYPKIMYPSPPSPSSPHPFSMQKNAFEKDHHLPSDNSSQIWSRIFISAPHIQIERSLPVYYFFPFYPDLFPFLDLRGDIGIYGEVFSLGMSFVLFSQEDEPPKSIPVN